MGEAFSEYLLPSHLGSNCLLNMNLNLTQAVAHVCIPSGVMESTYAQSIILCTLHTPQSDDP